MQLMVGVPLGASPDAKASIKATFAGSHNWQADGQSCFADVAQVMVAGQPVGALYDWLLAADGSPLPDRKSIREREIGIISIGMNTIEMLVVEHLSQVDVFTGSHQVGVRRLLELSDPHGLYSIAEMDERLRAGHLDISTSLPIWLNDVTGVIDRQWPDNKWRRFAAIVVVGGGSLLLEKTLRQKFGLLAQLASVEDAVIATARGLYKFALSKKLREAVAFDAGFGAVKIYRETGAASLPAAVASNGDRAVSDLAGLKAVHRPLRIESPSGSFYVGQGAHKFGRPVQSLDLDRLTGPEMLALFYGVLTPKG